MKAITYSNYGNSEVLDYCDIDKPIVKNNELLIEIKNSSLNMADVITMTGLPKITRLMTNGFRKPNKKILGCDFSGVVVALGADVKGYSIGDKILGDVSNSGFGAFAQYLCVTADQIAAFPNNVSFEDAATIPVAGCTAYRAIEAANIKVTDKVLINGASGCVGMFALQLAKYKGAHVTGVCSTSKTALVKELGADVIIDYKKDDFLQMSQRYDVIIDTAIHKHLKYYKNVMTEKSLHLLIGGDLGVFFQSLILAPFLSRKNGKRIQIISAKVTSKDLSILAKLLGNGTIKARVDKIFELKDTNKAMSYYQSKKAIGKVVIKM